MDSIIDLQKKVQAAKTRANILQSRIDKAKEKNILPDLKKTYIGRCYVYRNAYGPENKWNLYRKIKDIEWVHFYENGEIQVTAILFEFEYHKGNNLDGEMVLSVCKKADFSLSILGEEITQGQFDAAWNRVIESVKKLKE